MARLKLAHMKKNRRYIIVEVLTDLRYVLHLFIELDKLGGFDDQHLDRLEDDFILVDFVA